MNFLSFDVGGTETKYSLISMQGEIIESGSYPTVDERETILQGIVTTVHTYQERGEQLRGLCFSVPGAIDTKRGHMITGGAMLSMYDMPLKQELEQRTGLTVELENDVNCVALAERWLGNAQGSDNFVCITIGTGVGGAIFMNGQMLHGHRYGAGEFGLMMADRRPDHMDGSVNIRGSVRGGIIRSYAKLANVDDKNIDGKKVFALAEAGDEIAQQVIDEFFEAISYAVYNVSVVFNPEKILLGGAITSRPGLVERIDNVVQEITQQACFGFEARQIMRCKFANNSGKIGAVYHFMLKHGLI